MTCTLCSRPFDARAAVCTGHMDGVDIAFCSDQCAERWIKRRGDLVMLHGFRTVKNLIKRMRTEAS